MEKRILTILFFVISVLSYSQNKEFNYPNFIGQNISLIENNLDWRIIQKVSGDLNKNGIQDFALILESKDSIPEKRCTDCELVKNKPRIILVLASQNGERKVIIQNDKFIARGDEGGMLPYLEPELSIKNGLLTIYYEYTRSNQSYTFEFKNDKMKILRAESKGVHSASGDYENDKFDFKKREIISNTGNISQEKEITKIIKFKIKPKSLSEFGKMYEWKITDDKYL